MPQYIDREKLPQFQYFNVNNDEHGWQNSEQERNGKTTMVSSAWVRAEKDDPSMDFYAEIDEDDLLELDDDIDKVTEILLLKSRADIAQYYDKWTGSSPINSTASKMRSLLAVLIKAMIKNEFTVEKWVKRFQTVGQDIPQQVADPNMHKTMTLFSYLKNLKWSFQFFSLIEACQGFPKQKGSEMLYPKMLLIKDEFYKNVRNEENHHQLDFAFLKESLGQEIYIININGQSAEKKMTFTLYEESGAVVISVLDPNNGLSSFIVNQMNEALIPRAKTRAILDGCKEEDLCISTFACDCHPRGDYYCNEFGSEKMRQCVYCSGTHNCKHKMMDIVSSVLYCYQEFQRKELFKNTAQKSSESGQKDSPSPVFIPDGMIKLYEVKLSKEEKAAMKKFGHSLYPSTEKSPHVRKSTMRYNPKTGQKDIYVKGCIIHKDRYNGFASAFRVDE